MLEKLLAMLRRGNVYSYADLARELGVSEALLEGMLENLARLGYLRLVSNPPAGCQSAGGSLANVGHCQGCSMKGACAVGGQGRVWTLTEKGSRKETI